MTRLATRACDCTYDTAMGQKRPEVCELHGNRFLTEAQLNPKPRKPLKRTSNGKRSSLKRGRSFAVTKAQRDKVRGLPCMGCGHEEGGVLVIDPAHLLPRGAGGCDDPDCIIPLCRSALDGRGCHPRYDRGELDLIEKLIDRGYFAEMAHAVERHHLSPLTLLERLTGREWQMVEREGVAA